MVDEAKKPGLYRIVAGLVLGLLAVILLVLVFAAGVFTGRSMEPTQETASIPASLTPLLPPTLRGTDSSPDDEVDLEVFWEAWNTVDQRFYGDMPSDEDKVYGAIQGMLRTLGDPHTVFLDPTTATRIREDNTGSFSGIGAEVEAHPAGGVLIVNVYEDAPAYGAGLRPGDVVIAVDGTDITAYVLDEAVQMIRGPEGTEVTLTVIREGEEEAFDVTITRARIQLPTVEYEMLDGNVGYVALFSFARMNADEQLENAIRDLQSQGAEYLILDLRNNPGGFLDQAISISDLFLDDGLVMIERDVEGNEVEYTSKSGGPAESIPLVVLINERSASASEIVAGAVQDRDRGMVIGETSFGKGSVQQVYDLSDGSQLRVTFAHWFTPNDHWITGEGVAPDIIVEMTPEAVESGDDPQLDRAIEFLLSGQ